MIQTSTRAITLNESHRKSTAKGCSLLFIVVLDRVFDFYPPGDVFEIHMLPEVRICFFLASTGWVHLVINVSKELE